jgi:hypothetical protein
MNNDFPKTINRLVFVTEWQCVFCVIGTTFLNVIYMKILILTVNKYLHYTNTRLFLT